MIRHQMACLLRPWHRLLLLLAIVAPPLAFALEPAWWAQRGIISTDSSGNRLAASDYAVINQGQLKNIVAAATAEMNAKMSGGAGPVLNGMITAWMAPDTTGTRQDHAAANVGQVKALAVPVYDRLINAGIVQDYPWSTSSSPASDYSLANIGQVKALFSFVLPFTNTDNDEMDDLWEQKIIDADPNDAITSFAHVLGSDDFDQDGVSNLEEWQRGTNPLSADTDQDGVSDLEEWQRGTNPLSSDTDQDGIPDGWEIAHGYNPLNPADVITGGAGNDTLNGGNGADMLNGGIGDDTLYGNAGDDYLVGGQGNDRLYGSTGSDTYVWNLGDGDDTIWDDRISGLGAVNRLVFGVGILPTDVTSEVVPSQPTYIKFVIRQDGVVVGSVIISDWTYEYNSVIHAETWRIDFTDETKWDGRTLGTALDDVLSGTSQADVIDGGAGNDTLNGLDGDDTLTGGAGIDTINGGDGADLLDGGIGNDKLDGKAGDDYLVGGQGNDQLYGDTGNDTYVWNLGDGDDTITDDHAETTASNTLILNGIDKYCRISFVNLDDYKLEMRVKDEFEGESKITITNFYNNYHFSSWKLQIDGQGTYEFSGIPTTGNNVLIGLNTGVILFGMIGNDTLTGGAGNDWIMGDEGNDSLVGGLGNDILRGDVGIDTLSGGLGNDLYFFENGDGNDTVSEVVSLSESPDDQNIIAFGSGVIPNDISVDRMGDHLRINYGSPVSSVTVLNWFQESSGLPLISEIRFNEGNVWNHSFIESRVGLGSVNSQNSVQNEPTAVADEELEQQLDEAETATASSLVLLTPLQ